MKSPGFSISKLGFLKNEVPSKIAKNDIVVRLFVLCHGDICLKFYSHDISEAIVKFYDAIFPNGHSCNILTKKNWAQEFFNLFCITKNKNWKNFVFNFFKCDRKKLIGEIASYDFKIALEFWNATGMPVYQVWKRFTG